MKLTGLSQKRWFSWILIAFLVISNIISFVVADNYFSKINNVSIEEVKVENSMLGSGSRIIDMAREILRFFRNP
ncbi:MAG: hypothetical protein JNM67_06060 [Bacteroidetes bacterium]|nr:hypothetical protein [Bacteroidota bacterium]